MAPPWGRHGGGPGQLPPVQTGSHAQTTLPPTGGAEAAAGLGLRAPPPSQRHRGEKTARLSLKNTRVRRARAPAAFCLRAVPPLQRRDGLPPPPEAMRRPKAVDFQSEIKIYYATHIFNRSLQSIQMR